MLSRSHFAKLNSKDARERRSIRAHSRKITTVLTAALLCTHYEGKERRLYYVQNNEHIVQMVRLKVFQLVIRSVSRGNIYFPENLASKNLPSRKQYNAFRSCEF